MLDDTLHDLARVIRAIEADQEKLPTPCTAMDVLTLRRHLSGWLHLFSSALTEPGARERPDPAAHPGPDLPEAAAGQILQLAATVRAARAGGYEALTVHIPQLGGDLPGAMVLDSLLIEALGHGWDLARATGQEWQPDPAACERALGVLRQIVQPEYRGDGLPFGPEVTVADEAPALDRLVAFTGRDPGWAPRP